MLNQWRGRLLRRNWGDIGLSFLEGKTGDEISNADMLKAIQGMASGLNQFVEEIASMFDAPQFHQEQLIIMAPKTTKPDDGLIDPGTIWADPVPPPVTVDLDSDPPIVPPGTEYPFYAPLIVINPFGGVTGNPDPLPPDIDPGETPTTVDGGFSAIFVGPVWMSHLIANNITVNQINDFCVDTTGIDVVVDIDYNTATHDIVSDVELNTSTCVLTVTKQERTYVTDITPVTEHIYYLTECEE